MPDASVDCVISNCVLNLAPDKPAVFREIARVLKPGGRLAVSDIALKGELPHRRLKHGGLRRMHRWSHRIDDYRNGLLAAGFEHVEIVDSGADLNAYAKVENQSGCCSPAMDNDEPAPDSRGIHAAFQPQVPTLHEDLTPFIEYDVNAAAASVKVYAIKPKAV